MSAIIDDLTRVLRERRTASPESSYTASLFAGGLAKISLKLHEELDELLEAAEEFDGGESGSGNIGALVHEAADLWFHSMVLLTYHQIDPRLVLDELQRRFGTSGHEAKRSREARGGE